MKVSDLDTLAKRIWHHSPREHFKNYEEFRHMFDTVTERAWGAVEQASFESKEEFASVYWTAFQEKNLRRQERTDKSRPSRYHRKGKRKHT